MDDYDKPATGERNVPSIEVQVEQYLSTLSKLLISQRMNPVVLRDQMATLDALIDAGRRAQRYASMYRHRYLYVEQFGDKK